MPISPHGSIDRVDHNILELNFISSKCDNKKDNQICNNMMVQPGQEVEQKQSYDQKKFWWFPVFCSWNHAHSKTN